YPISVTVSDDDGGSANSSGASGGGAPDVAVLGANDGSFFTFSNLNSVMTTAPGASTWSLTAISASQLTTSALAPFEVLVINTSDRSFVNPAVLSAVTTWVNGGGTLILGPASGLAGFDSLMGNFGASYPLEWNTDGWCGFAPSFANPSNPLLTTPNLLD